MSFELLSEPIRRFIRDQRWEELRPIQNAAISRILTTTDNFILASRTASGKTEAAFLPILSQINPVSAGVQVLYISPLKALINDQFYRVEELCKYLDAVVTKWHGEANRSAKERLVKNPNGIVLITPESLEAMLANKPFVAKHLFSNLKFAVVDEIHSFISTDRGIHLKSILSRLQAINEGRFRTVGLSATIGDYEEAKKFTGDAENTKVLLDRTPKEVEANFRFFEADENELPLALLKDLYLVSSDKKTLIFPNSRGRTEEVAVKLKKIADRVGGHQNYFSHHSSVDKEVREYVEFFAKSARRENFAIACTSTLELGIDIGTVDSVSQIDATHSVSSLVQRVGRSGRTDGRPSSLYLFATDGWNLLQSLASWTLYREGIIEPPEVVARPYDILFHQAMSITKGSSGIGADELLSQLTSNFAFSEIGKETVEKLIDHLIATEMLEKVSGELIIGLEGEKLVNSRDFYSVFETEVKFKVLHLGRPVGEIPFSPQIIENENIFLAARIWKIVHVDHKAMSINVVPARDGKKPKFSGGGGKIHPVIRERMLEILFSKDEYDLLDTPSRDQLETFRREFSCFCINDTKHERPMQIKETKARLFTFTGTKINTALRLLLELEGIDFSSNEHESSIEIPHAESDPEALTRRLQKSAAVVDGYINQLLEDRPALRSFSKWSKYLPLNLQVDLLKQKYYDFDGAAIFLNDYRFVRNEPN